MHSINHCQRRRHRRFRRSVLAWPAKQVPNYPLRRNSEQPTTNVSDERIPRQRKTNLHEAQLIAYLRHQRLALNFLSLFAMNDQTFFFSYFSTIRVISIGERFKVHRFWFLGRINLFVDAIEWGLCWRLLCLRNGTLQRFWRSSGVENFSYSFALLRNRQNKELQLFRHLSSTFARLDLTCIACICLYQMHKYEFTSMRVAILVQVSAVNYTLLEQHCFLAAGLDYNYIVPRRSTAVVGTHRCEIIWQCSRLFVQSLEKRARQQTNYGSFRCYPFGL